MANPALPIQVRPVQAISNVRYEFMPHRIGSDPIQPMEMVGCPGERVNLAFYAMGCYAVHDLMVTTTNPSVDVRWIKWWWQAGRTTMESDRPQYVPELLLHDGNMVNASPRTAENSYPVLPEDSKTLQPIDCADDGQMGGFEQGVMLTLVMPERGGSFLVTVTGGGSDVEFIVKVKVLPLRLPKLRIDSSMYYRARMNRDAPGIDPEWRTPAQMQADLENMVAHGVTNPNTYCGQGTLREVLALRQAAGVSNRRFFTGNGIGHRALAEDFDRSEFPGLKRTAEDTARAMVAECAGYGVEEVFVSGRDEAPAVGIWKQAPLWKAARKGGLHIFAAASSTPEADMLRHIADMQDVVIRSGTWPSQECSETLLANGIETYVYGKGNGHEDPTGNRRNLGLILFLHPWISGVMEYTYMHVWPGNEHPWDDLHSKDHWRSHMLAYPTMTGVVDTLQWEGYAMGLVDYRYLQLLEETADTPETREFFERISRERDTVDLDSMRAECQRLLLK